MEIFVFQNVNYCYPESETKALKNLSFSIPKGSFTILCGPSGCGKSTLLRHLKTCLKPSGVFTGEILFKGTPLEKIDTRTQAKEIGFVLQSPDNQVVTDKVWHELAFGLESLGYDTPTIRKRVAEMASFFGIENWFYKNVNELSGGQKQLLSLASVMAMQPDVLILDEPTAQLDPIAAADFLAVLSKINRELGTTVILTEHRLEEAFPFATQVLVMEKGELICNGLPEEVGMQLKSKGNQMFLAMPTAMRVWAALDSDKKCPMTVRDGANFLTEYSKTAPIRILPKEKEPSQGETVLEGDQLWFRYEKDQPDILKGFSFSLKKGEFYALLGGNGTGKTTAMKALAGLHTPYRGKVKFEGKRVHLPQNPQALFVKRTVREDLYEVFSGLKIPKSLQDEKVSYVVEVCKLNDFLDRHPYDISGGEQQRAALAKVLLTDPDILLLDEPTKGFDAEFKVTFAGILRQLLENGISILMVSHDVVFCSEYADKCGLFFDGSIVTEGTPRRFFGGNSFYTTPSNRMARHLFKEAVTVSDIVYSLGGKVKEPEKIKVIPKPLPSPKETSVNYKPKPLPLWKRLLAGVFALLVLGAFIAAIQITNLNDLIGKDGLTPLAKDQIWIYLALFVGLFGFILTVGRRAPKPIMVQTPKEKRKLSKRTVVASTLILLFIPLTIFAGLYYLGDRSYNIIALAVLLECMIPFFLVFEGRKPKARELVIIAVLCAIGVAGRMVFFMLPQFKPIIALTIIAGVAFGGETGFLVGAVTMLASNMMFHQGPWTPWQMFSMGIIGFLAGILFRKGLIRRSRIPLAIFGAIVTLVVYGGIMNGASALIWSTEKINWGVMLGYYISGLPMDLIHASATFVFLMLGAEPMLEKLDRIKVKYGLVE